ncbi:MAG: histone deacetylase family protein [Promethearchaeota archaeon]
MKTGIVYDDWYLKHKTGMHVESPQRVTSMLARLEDGGLYPENPNFPVIAPRKATLDQVRWIHNQSLVRQLQEDCEKAGESDTLRNLDADTVVSKDSYEASLYAVGGNLEGIDKVWSGEVDNGFALVRPPGHHTNRESAHGFCLFNNVSIAAEYLFRKKGVKRVAIVDFDCHHGNGTEDIFYSNSESGDLLFFSTHQDGRTLYPGSGFPDEKGAGDGEGRIVNIPQAPRTGDESVKAIRDEVIGPILRDFKPEFILSSVGFDCHYTDPITSLGWTVQGYGNFAADLKTWADELCGGKLLLTLEGGYELKAISRACFNVFLALNGKDQREFDKHEEDPRVLEYTKEKLVPSIRKIFSEYYSF